MKDNEFKCAMCKGVFKKSWSGSVSFFGDVRIKVINDLTGEERLATEHNTFFYNGFLHGIQRYLRVVYEINMCEPPLDIKEAEKQRPTNKG